MYLRRFLWAAAAATLFALAAGSAGAEDSADASSPLLVKIHADWCGTCTRLNPTWEELRARHGADTRLVVLDVTDREAAAAAAAEADRLGIREFYDDYKSQTGTIGILTARGETVRVLKGETDVSRYEAPLAHARGGSPS